MKEFTSKSVYSIADVPQKQHDVPSIRIGPRPVAFTGLLTNKILTELPGGDFARLLPYFEPVSLSAGHQIYEISQDIEFVYFPETSVVSHMYFLEDGSTTGATIVGNEGMVGLSALLNSLPPYWTMVIVGGSAVRVRSEIIKAEFAAGSSLQQLLLSYLGARLTQLSQKAVCNAHHKLEERLCSWLLMVQDRTSQKQLPLTHEEIAQHLSARRAGITSACTALREAGILNYRRGKISIVDRSKLEELACQCYSALKEFKSQQGRSF
jgi:CRP-like cAMP-binding protein